MDNLISKLYNLDKMCYNIACLFEGGNLIMEFDINKYSKILDKIEDNLNLYYNKYLDCTRFILYLSNDEKIEIDYNTSSIPHLLGIDTNALISTGVFPNNSFEVLNSIIENPNRLIGLINNNHIKIKSSSCIEARKKYFYITTKK